MKDAVLAAGRYVGVLPRRLHVRDEALTPELAPGVAARGITVAVAEMPDLDEAIEESLARITEDPTGGFVTTPATWAETEATREEIAAFHRAAAAFYRAAPWEVMSGGEPLEVHFDDGRSFLAVVMGNGGLDYGLALYSAPEDLIALMEGGVEDDPFERLRRMRGWSMSASYEARSYFSRAMQREVAAAGWEVAGASAHPMILGVRVPGQRVTAEHVRIATRALTGVLYELCGAEAAAGLADPGVLVTGGDDEEVPWEPLEEAHPIGATGPGANPGAALSLIWEDLDSAIDRVLQAEDRRADRFAAHLDSRRVTKEARRRYVRNARVWSEYVAGVAVTAGAVTEFDLRRYLYDWFPRKVQVPKDVERGLAESLRVFFAWLEVEERIAYPWAGGVLDEYEQVRAERGPAPDGWFWEPEVQEWRAALWHDLDRRVMFPDTDIPGAEDGWPAMMNLEVGNLGAELQRRWLIWYDEEVHAGTCDPGALWSALVQRQREWEKTPHPALDGRTPLDAVLELEANRPSPHRVLQVLPQLV